MSDLTTKQRATLEKAASTIRTLQESESGLKAQIETLSEKVAGYDRLALAEEIATLQSSADPDATFEDVMGVRDRLAASGDDLGHMKIAMQTYGPGRVQLRSVTDAPSLPTDKVAGSTAEAGSEPAHIAQAREALNAKADSLQG